MSFHTPTLRATVCVLCQSMLFIAVNRENILMFRKASISCLELIACVSVSLEPTILPLLKGVWKLVCVSRTQHTQIQYMDFFHGSYNSFKNMVRYFPNPYIGKLNTEKSSSHSKSLKKEDLNLGVSTLIGPP